MSHDKSSVSLDCIPKDVAKIVARYVGNFIPLSSVNKQFYRFFQQEREAALKKVKIMVKENGNSSFLLTFDGKLYACGQNKVDHFGCGDKKVELPRDMRCYRQWTRIGPLDRKISEVVLEDENSVFVRCGNEWFGAGDHPYIQYAQRRDKSHSPWISVLGPEPFFIVELIPTATQIFMRGKDGFCYVYSSNAKTSKNCWEKIGPPHKKIEKMLVVKGRIFLQCSEGWYGEGENKNGELGLGFSSDWVNWEKMGPKNKKVLELKANQCNTFVYCDDEKWYGCGSNERGQLGTGDIEAQLNWIAVGPADKKISGFYILKGRTFITCSDELYGCGVGRYVRPDYKSSYFPDRLNWVQLKWRGGKILNIVGEEDVIFIEGMDGWYGCGDDDTGILGRGYDTWRKNPKKLNCHQQSVLKVVASPHHIFAFCKEGWYFSGRNYEGQNGMNDDKCSRNHWIKLFSYGENIEQAVSTSLLNLDRINNESLALRFRRSLKKLYEPYYISILEHMFNDYVGGILKIGYNVMYEDKYRFFFFLEAWDFNNLADSHVDELPWLLRSLMDFLPLIFLGDEEFNGGGFPWYLRGSERQNYPFPTHQVDLRVENYEAICQFLQGYEKMLDEHELEFNEKSDELDSGNSKYICRKPL